MRMTSSHVQCLCFRTCLNSVNISKQHFEYDPHWSALLTERSRLFICVKINSWCMLVSIAATVCWVNSAHFFSGKSTSTISFLIFQEEMFTILTFQSHISLRRIFGIQNFREMNCLKSSFSNFPGPVPLIFILCISQVIKFIGYLGIKFGEDNHQRNCKEDIYQSVSTQ